MFKRKKTFSIQKWLTNANGKASARTTVTLAADHVKTSSVFFSSPFRFRSLSQEFLINELR